MFWKSKKQAPFWTDYLSAFDSSIDGSQLIDSVSFVVLDTETTGLAVKEAEVLEIGALLLTGNRIAANSIFECFIEQTQKQYNEAINIHGILPHNNKNTFSLTEALPAFLSFCGSKIIVGHHIQFDIAMVNKSLKKIGGGSLKNKSVDLMDLAIRLEEGPFPHHVDRRKYTLDSLCARYDIKMENRHTALGDAVITALLFQKILARLGEVGVVEVRDIL